MIETTTTLTPEMALLLLRNGAKITGEGSTASDYRYTIILPQGTTKRVETLPGASVKKTYRLPRTQHTIVKRKRVLTLAPPELPPICA